jgi:membrane-associated phospholipid phosphatase
VRNAELINLVIFAYYTAAGWLLGIPLARRLLLTLISAGVIAGMLAIPQVSRAGSPLWMFLRDWLPVPLVVLAYRQTGRFFAAPDPWFQSLLERSDAWISDRALADPRPGTRVLLEILEGCYMLCYVMVPLGLAALYLLGFQEYANVYWAAVLIPTYICYATAPFLRAMPPRYTGHDSAPKGPLRRLNFWILNNVSIHANTFPSGHATAACSIALILLALSPAVGAIFAIIGSGICIGATVGRYHYTLDVLLGAFLSLVTVTILLS